MIAPLTEFIKGIAPLSSLSLICAELYFCVAHSKEIIGLRKKEAERTPEEKLRVQPGLKRELLWNALFFVPISVVFLNIMVFSIFFTYKIEIPFFFVRLYWRRGI